MSPLPPNDPRRESAAQSDEALLAAHEQAAERWKAEDGARYRMLPLGLILVFSGLVLIGANYLNRYSGRFSPDVYNENGLPGKAGAAPKALDPVALGRRQFQTACATCHQATGLGVAGVYPPLAGSEWANGAEDRLVRLVLYGLTGPVRVKGVDFPGAVAMPAFSQDADGYKWRDDQIAAVLTYVRQEWGNQAPPITTETVTKIRTSLAPRKPWTAAELEASGR